MAGVKLRLPAAVNSVTGADLPKWRVDPLLSAGSLVLFDAGHSLTGLSAVPAHNDALYNIAWEPAAAAIGSGTETSLKSVFQDFHQAADATFELSGKKGIHGIYSQVNNTSNTRGAYIFPANAVLQYLADNPTHDIYISQWSRITRAMVSGTYYGYANITSLLPNTSGILARLDSNGYFPTTGQYIGSTLTPGTNDLNVPIFRALAVSGWTTQEPTPGVTNSVRAMMLLWGNGLAWQSAATNKSPSQIHYRCYLEDLTESGRTFAEVEAIDRALWTEAFAAGGRYYNDSFTDPATFP